MNRKSFLASIFTGTAISGALLAMKKHLQPGDEIKEMDDKLIVIRTSFVPNMKRYQEIVQNWHKKGHFKNYTVLVMPKSDDIQVI
jgi:hypothetical protein